MRPSWRMPCLVLVAVSLASPARAEVPAPGGVVFLAGGVGGLDPLIPWGKWILPRAGVPHELHEFRWCHGVGRLLRDLQDTRHLLACADRLAEEVRLVKRADPRRPVYLVGHSAGAGIVLAAAERLPPATLERIILLSPAVSPEFDLSPALRATRAEVVSFHSCLDCFWLGWGTSHFGTVDRVYGPGAGMNGFVEPTDDETIALLYRRLVQIEWKPKMVWAGHGGLHVSTCSPWFLARQVAPWLLPGPSLGPGQEG